MVLEYRYVYTNGRTSGWFPVLCPGDLSRAVLYLLHNDLAGLETVRLNYQAGLAIEYREAQ